MHAVIGQLLCLHCISGYANTVVILSYSPLVYYLTHDMHIRHILYEYDTYSTVSYLYDTRIIFI